jgi:hypothetical protein
MLLRAARVIAMPITYTVWANGYDVHVLRGQSTVPLSKLLEVWPKTGLFCSLDDYLHVRNQTDVSVEFRPVFRCDDTAAGFSGFGIHVDRDDGTVKVDPGQAPAHQPANFLVEATVVRNGTVLDPPDIPVRLIRIHIHDSVRKIWLTPPGLGIRRPVPTGACQTNYAFAVRAEFDDETVGDVTYGGALTFSPATHFYVKPNQWEQRIQLPADAVVGSTIPVTVSMGGATSDPVDIKVLEPWATEPNVPNAVWIDGHTGVMNGSVKPENVPNVVFVACGFSDPQVFATMVTNTHLNLTTDSSLRPYNFLRKSMAFWHLPIPAAHDGICVQSEVWPFTRDGKTFAVPLPKPVAPELSGDWTLANLMYMAGLPIPDDVNRTMPELNDRWDAAMPDLPDRVVDLSVVDAWLALAKRSFIDEIDTFPSVSAGVPPSADSDDTSILGDHYLRGDDDERGAFLARVTARPIGSMAPITLGVAPPGDGIGNMWAKDHPAFPFDDTRFVVNYCNAPYGRAISGIFTRLSLSPLTTDDEFPGFPVVPVVGRNALRLDVPQPTIATVLDGTWKVIGHELAHNFGLGDEYVEEADTSTQTEEFIDDANLTSAAAALDANGAPRLDQIKWNWPRTRKAVVTTGPIVPLGPKKFQVPVAFAAGFQLAVGEPVLLRKREKRKIIARLASPGPEFTVDLLGPDGDKIIIVTTASGVNLSTFTAGSVLYKPFIAPADVTPPRRYLTLISPAAERIMGTIKGPMNGVTCNGAANAAMHAATETPVQPDPQNRVAGIDLSFLIGIYHGADRHACGILRPAGQCMMRGSHEVSVQFCPVCQFVLVDQIDPEQHRHIDYEYQKVYPL